MRARQVAAVVAFGVLVLVSLSGYYGLMFGERRTGGQSAIPATDENSGNGALAAEPEAEFDRAEPLAVPALASPEATWRTVGRWVGVGPMQTQRFVTSKAEWRLSWKTADGVPLSAGCFSVYVYSDFGDFVSLAVNTVGAQCATSYVNASPGSFFLDVNSRCQSWELTVEEPAGDDRPALPEGDSTLG